MNQSEDRNGIFQKEIRIRSRIKRSIMTEALNRNGI